MVFGISPSDLFVRNEEIIFSKIDNETVMMDTDFDNYYGMDTVASRIWELLENETTFLGLCTQLLQEFDVSKEQCERETQLFLQELIEHKMVVLKSE